MKVKLLLSFFIILMICGSIQAQKKRDKPIDVSLDAEDERIIKDTTQELMNLHLELEIIDDRIRQVVKHSQSIIRPYCKCTDQEFEAYWQGKGLASIINRMNAQKFSAKDSSRLHNDLATMNRLKDYRSAKQGLFEATIKLFESRMRESAFKHCARGVANYKLDLINRRFIYIEDSLQVPSLMESIKEYLTDYSKKVVEDLKETVHKLQQQNEELRAKNKEKKQKATQHSTKSKAYRQ